MATLQDVANKLKQHFEQREIERTDICTDPENCKRCRAAVWQRHGLQHAGIPMRSATAPVARADGDANK